MDPAYEKILQRGKRQEKAFTRLLAGWRDRSPKDLDRMLAEAGEAAFAEIDCTRCGNCCRSLGPLVKEREIPALAKLTGTDPAGFEARHLKRDEDGDLVFRSLPCPFLDGTGLCSVYHQRPWACADYPHLDRKKQASRTRHLEADARVCPAVVVALERFL